LLQLHAGPPRDRREFAGEGWRAVLVGVHREGEVADGLHVERGAWPVSLRSPSRNSRLPSAPVMGESSVPRSRAPASSTQSVNPPVEAPTSSTCAPCKSRENFSSAAASFSPPRLTKRGGCSM